MGKDSGMTLSVSQDLVLPVIEQKIHAAIVETLNEAGHGNLIAHAVSSTLTQKVDSKGNINESNYNNTRPYIEWLCEQGIRIAARKGVEAWIANNEHKISDAVEKEMKKQTGAFAKAFVEAVQGTITSTYSFKVGVELNKRND